MFFQVCFVSIAAILVVSHARDFKYSTDRAISCDPCTRAFADMDIKLCESSACKALKHIIITERKKSSWNAYYELVSSFIASKFGNNAAGLKIVEIGTCWGGNAAHLAKSFPCSNIVAVDPFLSGYDDKDLSSKIYGRMESQTKLSPEGFSDAYASAMFSNIAHDLGRCNYDLIHDFSVKGATKFANSTVDFIFIDGLHTYEGVVADIQVFMFSLA
jgi:hypothetical protein